MLKDRLGDVAEKAKGQAGMAQAVYKQNYEKIKLARIRTLGSSIHPFADIEA